MKPHFIPPVGGSMVANGGNLLEGQDKMVVGGFVEKIVNFSGALGVGGG